MDGPCFGACDHSAGVARFVSQNLTGLLARTRREDLTVMHQLMEAGKVTPVIDRCYRLSEVPEAIRYLEQGHARGKVVITFGSSSG